MPPSKTTGRIAKNAAISLSPDEITQLEKAAEWGKISKSQVVRELLKYLPNWYYDTELAKSKKKP